MKMSREKSLQKAIVLSLVLTNIWCGAAYADNGADGADGTVSPAKTDAIGSGGLTADYTESANNGTAGGDYTRPYPDLNPSEKGGGKGGNGGGISAAHTVSGTVSGAISITAAAGNGGNGGNSAWGNYKNTFGGDGGSGGNVDLGLTVIGAVLDGNQNITLTATGGSGGNGGNSNGYEDNSVDDRNNKGGQGGNGGDARAKGLILTGDAAQTTVTVADIIITATGGKGGNNGSTYDAAAMALPGSGGAAAAYGITSVAAGNAMITAANITVKAVGGSGGDAGAKNSFYKGDVVPETNIGGGEARATVAYGLQAQNSDIALTAQAVSVTATGGTGGAGGGKGYVFNTDGTNHGESLTALNGDVGAVGGAAYAAAFDLQGGAADLKATTVASTASGGVGGAGGAGGGIYAGDNRDGGTGGTGGVGGTAEARGLSLTAGNVILQATAVTANSAGGNGGNGGDGGSGSTGGNGGNGGTGGNAYAYGVWGGEKSVIKLTADSITAKASAGDGGTAGNGGTGGQKGDDGLNGEAAEAYGVYAEKGAVITLSAKTDGGNGGTITIGAKAENAQSTKAYAIYADNATVLFNDNAVLNSDGSSTDNDVITYLNNATLGFGTPGEGQNVGRTINGGTLQLAGSNTFKVATDLSNVIPNADKFTFAKLAAGSSTATQYITVGYDKAFDGSKLDSFIGDVTVLTVTNLAAGQNLNNFVGKASEMDDPLTRFLATPTVAVSADSTGNGGVVKITQIDFAEAGASETVMTAADAQMSIGNLWRVEGNNLMKRMGDLRSDPEAAKGGVWARYYRGEMSADSAYDRSFDQDYTAFQGGIDKVQDYKGGKLYTGIAVNRIDGNASYNSGNGDLSSTGVGLYASWLGSKGHYLDVIARGSKLANDFKLVDKSGNIAKGDYDTWAYGISAEYGYRQDLQGGWFVEPQAELSLGRIGSADYTMSNGTEISQDAVNSAVTRIGVLSGKEFTMNGRQGNAYVKASLLHDFGGNGGGAAYYNGRSTVVESADMSGTWWEIGLGANLGIAKNSNLYFDALKTFGGDLRTEWQFNAGLRFTF